MSAVREVDAALVTAQGALENDPLWYKGAVVYELHIKAYADGNGDGIGDFRGLTAHLDHVQSLGVNTIWLLPFYPSPLRDDGYDVADYESVHPSYGTLDDFRAFVAEAHRRGLRVITELVVNHTSDQHPWFQAARQAPKGSPDRNFYVWSDDPTLYSGTRIIFTDTEKSNWTWDEVAGQYFWHRFFSHQPDLNFDNPAVLEAVLRTMGFWLEMGVDGFRLDAIPYLIERDGTSNENLRETHEVIKAIRRRVEDRYPGRLLLAEANMWPEDDRNGPQQDDVVKITNNSTSTIDTHLLVIVQGLPQGVQMVNASGKTSAGEPYLRVFLSKGELPPGRSLVEALRFAPGVGAGGKDRPVNYTLKLLSGQGNP